MPDIQSLMDLRLFSASFLDGELKGSPLEGLFIDTAVDSYIEYLNTLNIHAGQFEKIKRHFSFLSKIAKYLRKKNVNIPDVATEICDYLTANREVLIPGGWAGCPGHAIIYRLLYESNGDLIFLDYNTGCGITYHKQTLKTTDLAALEAEDFVETYSPVYTIRFSDQEKIKQFGGLHLWISKLMEINSRPLTDPKFKDNSETGLYDKILPLCAYLGGQEVDPAQYVPRYIIGQLDGVCVKAGLDNVLWELFSAPEDYEQFVFNYKIYLLNTYLDEQKIPGYFKAKFAQALEHTARMLSPGTMLEANISTASKAQKLSELESIKAKAQCYFQAPPAQAVENTPTSNFEYLPI